MNDVVSSQGDQSVRCHQGRDRGLYAILADTVDRARSANRYDPSGSKVSFHTRQQYWAQPEGMSRHLLGGGVSPCRPDAPARRDKHLALDPQLEQVGQLLREVSQNLLVANRTGA